LKKEDLKQGCIEISYRKFEILEERIREVEKEYRADSIVPDFDKIIALSKSPWDFLNYLIWYEETADDNDGTNLEVSAAIEQAWDYINHILSLHK